MNTPNGAVVYHGPSRINGGPVVAVLTGLSRPSRNSATGSALQLYILDAATNPTTAYYGRGTNRSVCGDCVHHRFHTCYVTWWREAEATWQAWRRGSYSDYGPGWDDRVRGRVVRWGAAGDPAALPVALTRSFWKLVGAHHWLAYSHQWRKRRFQALRRYCMASVETEADFFRARRLGWKPFRTLLPGEPMLPGEFSCPKSEEAGHRLTCDRCRACRGGEWNGQATPAVRLHGTLPATRNNLVAHLTLIRR